MAKWGTYPPDEQLRLKRNAAEELYEALQVCANKFWEYVIMHEAKGPEGMEKAQRNREMAEECERALAKARGEA